jgi:site-specific recombinase XerD
MGDMIKILFYARKSKTNPGGLTPIYLRVTASGQRFQTATARFVEIKNWSQSVGRVIGNSKEAKELNEFLDVLRAKAFDIQKKLITVGSVVSIENFEKQWHGVEEKSKMLLEVFQTHNDQVKILIGQQYSNATWRRYVTSLDHTRRFLNEEYQLSDIPVKQIKYKFITDYEFWLKSKRKCNHNSTIKYLTNFKKIVNICLKNCWLEKNPFLGFKMTKIETDRPYLSAEELETIKSKAFASERLNQVRDIYLFSCYTGLAYADTKNLTSTDVSIGIDGEKWILIKREKTNTPSRIPLLPPALEIIEKYKDHPKCININRLLPLLSNQKMNGYLHEIASVCGINKEMTYHTARHTFATTITLTNGVPIESVSKMLGHKSLRTTQHYAKIIDKKVSEDMNMLRSKFASAAKQKSETGISGPSVKL